MNQEQYSEFKESAENYRAFLLRCWQEADAGPSGEPQWRFTLVQMGEGQTKKGFASLEDLVTYLRGELDAAPLHTSPEAHKQGG